MLPLKLRKKYYKALLSKSTEYDGIFYIGVKTTGVFCRPSCPARKPKLEHCEFFQTVKEALLAAFRPCKRCKPLSNPFQVSDTIQKLIEAIEKQPEKRWKDSDFQALSTDATQARRQFKKRFGMTFVEFARARRMGIAIKHIRSGEKVINAQLASGYESGSGFRDAFSQIMGTPPASASETHVLKASWLDTQLGPMIIIADDEALYLLEFVDRRGLEREVERLRIKTKSAIIPGDTPITKSISKELNLYFGGKLKEFTTPVRLLGSKFQKNVWNQLKKIPYGETRSYLEIANAIKHPKAFRAVANANGANQLCLIIPCHRVINNNGELGGYGGGISRKQWLIDHERRHQNIK